MTRTDESAARLLSPSGLWPREAPEDVRAFLDQHSELRRDKNTALDLAYDEYCRIAEAGETPDPDAFCARFPTFQASLRRAIQAHEYLAANPGLLEEREEIPWPIEGQTYLGYRLVRELGRGAFARVFLAEEPDLANRLVVVKISPRSDTELSALGRLNHPNFITTYTVRQDPHTDLTALCMHYLGEATLDGVLAARVAGGASRARVILDVARAGEPPAVEPGEERVPHSLLQTGTYAEGVCLLGAQLADALAFLHRRSIYHRDLKPSNVLLRHDDGRPMLLDFNLSADPGAEGNRLGGTLPYMSPEQILATFDPNRATDPVDGQSDIFALGVILFELLTGRQPFGEVPRGRPLPEDCAALLERQRQGAPALRRLCPEATPALARVVADCLAFDRRQRPHGAAEVAAVLRRDLAPSRRVLRRLRHHPKKVAAAALVVALAAGAVVSAAAKPSRATQPSQQAGAESAAPASAEAINRIDHAVLPEADSAETLVKQARRKMQVRSFLEAIGDLRQADRLRPDPLYRAGIAYCLAREGKWEDAVLESQQVLSANFETREVYNNLAYSLLGNAQTPEARESLDRALALDKSFPAARHNRLVLLKHELLHGRVTARTALAEAPGALDTALKCCPESAELYDSAANLCAAAFTRTKGTMAEHWGDLAITYLEHAAQLGLNFKDRTDNPLFIQLTKRQKARYEALVMAPHIETPKTLSARLVDPFAGR
jgi:serine/threonine protein kinase